MSPKTQCDLPAELWSKVLRYATLEDSVNEDDQVHLLHPTSSHKRSLANKRTIVGVCRRWRILSLEYLWESVGNITQSQLVGLACYLKEDSARGTYSRRLRKAVAQSPHSSLANPRGSGTEVDHDYPHTGDHLPRGWWIRSLITRFDFGDDLNTFILAITAIFPFCPNLTSFAHIHDYNGPLPTSVITSLAESCGRTLVRFQLDWGGVNIDDLIHLLDQTSLQHIALGCTFDPPASNLLPPDAQATHKRDFNFEKLRSLQFGNSEDGMIRRYNSHLLEAATWNVPSLTAVAIDIDRRTSTEEVVGFLQAHGSKLRTLSLTDSGRLEGIPVTWNEIVSMCPNLTELRASYNPFTNFNLEALTWEPQPSGHVELEGDGDDEAAVTETFSGALPELPQFITSPTALHLERLCFDKWEFFPGIDCVMDHGGGPHTPVTSAEDFLASVTAQQDDSIELAVSSIEEAEDQTSRKHSERLLSAYCRVLDHVFESLGGKMTPSLRTVQFDFHSGHLDLPEGCMDWWNDWLRKWHAKGLRVEGCQRQSLF